MKLEKKHIVIALIIITIIQVATRVYFGSKKEYYHMDEAYSYGLMNYDKLSIVDDEEFLNTWHDRAYYEDYLAVNKDEVKNIGQVYENQKNDVHPPFYYLLLRIAATFTVDHFSKWTGLILNIIIFAISNIFIYLIAKKLLKSPIYGLILCVINGFTQIALNSCLYIRMYELCNLNILIITYLHLRIYGKDELKITNMIPISICLLLGGLTHYYYFIFAAGLYAVYTYKCIKNKQYKNLAIYNGGVFIAAGLYLLIFPHAINHIFFGYRGVGNSSGLEGFIKSLGGYLHIINKEFFGYLFLALVIVVFVICIKKEKNGKKNNKYTLLMIVPIILYLLIVIKNSPYIESRYVMPIYSVTIIATFYVAKNYLNQYYDNKSTMFIMSLLFLIMIYSPCVTKSKLEFTYERYDHIAERIEEKNLPIIYVFNTGNNRFLDDIYLFTKADKSIIIDYNKIDEQEYKEMLKNNNENYILICNEGMDQDKVKSYIGGEINYMQRMNACDIYEVNFAQN